MSLYAVSISRQEQKLLVHALEVAIRQIKRSVDFAKARTVEVPHLQSSLEELTHWLETAKARVAENIGSSTQLSQDTIAQMKAAFELSAFYDECAADQAAEEGIAPEVSKQLRARAQVQRDFFDQQRFKEIDCLYILEQWGVADIRMQAS